MANGNSVVKYERGVTARDEFGASEIQGRAETATAAVAARERARIEAMFIMAERHPRDWDDVRVRLLKHCDRSGFAEVARYKKPVGKKFINGEWKDTYAEGLSVRFAEIARTEMGNTATESSVAYEDDLMRVIRAAVVDLERNNHGAREIAIAKVTEKKGKKNTKTQEWMPPNGREVISSRINTSDEVNFLVRATDDETRNRQNSEISKVHRDETLRMIPRDIRDDCEGRILATLKDPKKTDPTAARKKVIDSFETLNVLPSDLVSYIGVPLDRASPMQLDELRGLYAAIRDGETTFDAALKAKYDVPEGEDSETKQQHDARLLRQSEEQLERKKAEAANSATTAKSEPPAATTEPTEEEMDRTTREKLASEHEEQVSQRGFGFGKKK